MSKDTGRVDRRYDEAKSELEGSRESLIELLENVNAPKADVDFIEYFCSDEEDEEKGARRDVLYGLTASMTRSFANCCDRLVSDYGYSEEDVDHLRNEISGFNKIKEMIKLASCDYIDLKPYEVDMRYILDTYIRAEDSKTVSELGNMSLVELLLNGNTTTPADLIKDLPGNDEAKAETIDNNLQHEIVKKMSSNTTYYGHLSDMLQEIILRRKAEALSYEEYLRQVVEIAEAIMHPEKDMEYPMEIRDSAARRALYDYFEGYRTDDVIKLDKSIREALKPDWKNNMQKRNRIKGAIYDVIKHDGLDDYITDMIVDHLFSIVETQEEYDI